MSAALEDQLADEMSPEAEEPTEPDNLSTPPSDEEPEPEPDEEPEPEPEPEASGPLSEKDIEKLNQRLQGEADRHTKRVSEIMGDDAVALVKCEACDDKIPGWHWPSEVFPEGSPERTLYELLAGGTEAQMKHPDRYRVCDYCNGFGQVLTGARNDIHRVLVCPACKGDGYRDSERQEARIVSLPVPAEAVEAFQAAQPPAPEKDFLGRPVGHPNYGKMSSYLTAEEQALDAHDGFAVQVHRVAITVDTVCLIVIAVCSVILTLHFTQMDDREAHELLAANHLRYGCGEIKRSEWAWEVYRITGERFPDDQVRRLQLAADAAEFYFARRTSTPTDSQPLAAA